MEILKRVNQFRAENGLPDFEESEKMAKIAQERADEMAEGREPFAHFRKNGKRGYIDSARVGETRQELYFSNQNGTAREFSPSTDPQNAERVVAAWEALPSHREGLLDVDVTKVGFGTAIRGDTTAVVAVFTDKK